MVNDMEVSKDLLQETLVSAYLHKENFRQDSSFYTYCYKIAVNKAINYIQRQKVKKFIPIDSIMNLFRSKEAKVIDQMIEKEQQNQLKTEVNKLPARQKAIFISRIYEEMSFEEIGDQLAITSSAARSNFFQALKKIKLTLKKRSR